MPSTRQQLLLDCKHTQSTARCVRSLAAEVIFLGRMAFEIDKTLGQFSRVISELDKLAEHEAESKGIDLE